MDQLPVERITISVYGVVQGVGFRPFVARMARAHGIAGAVRNVTGHVLIDATATPEALHRFVENIKTRKPAGSHISDVRIRPNPFAPGEAAPQGFAILQSDESTGGAVMPSPDLSICDDCLRELFTEGDPRYRNAFISCTNCGPRISIMRRVPYDRASTSMDGFPLCPLCAAQYADVDDRRYHAQTVCCNACGPTLQYTNAHAQSTGDEALRQAIHALKEHGIIAVKGIGGYHLACSPFDESAVQHLRALKGREAKPFAVMFDSAEAVAAHCTLSDAERSLLESPARPIVLLSRKTASTIAPGVYADSVNLGAFLPYTPLQHLLLRETGPLIMTSANASSLPILYEDAEALAFLRAHETLAGVLYHDRPILRRLDDSVATVVLGEPQLIRRARGYVPLALPLPADAPPLVALGPQQKNTLCFYQDGSAFLTAETGDLDSAEAEAAYRETLASFGVLLRIRPELAVRDLHPGYVSTQIAGELSCPVIAVQHHHAHIASVMAEHGLSEPVIGVAFDGTGYGTDGTVWGGEFLIVSPEGFTRAGHIKPVAMLGSDESVRQCWKSAACMLHDAGIPPAAGDARQALVHAALTHGVNTIRSSSMGRLFDAVSALLGICQQSTYDGQGAIALENAAAKHLASGRKEVVPLPYAVTETDGLVVDFAPCIRALHAKAQAGESTGALALAFHITVGSVIEELCARLAKQHGIQRIALSGGVFHNRLLTERAVAGLRHAGLTVYLNRQVPPGDGGVSLGQARVALWQLQKEKEGKTHVHRSSR